MRKPTYQKLRLILGDQLNHQHSWFQTVDPECLYVLMEIRSETDYVRHHIQKVIGFFLAMRQFESELATAGHATRYIKLDDPENLQAFPENLNRLVQEYAIQEMEYQLPDEYRLDQTLSALEATLGIPVRAVDSEHFLATRLELEAFFKGKKTYLMERFYRHMRVKYNILMDESGEDPIGGQWNYDHDNRKKLPKTIQIPSPLHFYRKVTEIVDLLEREGVQTIGSVDPERFNWPISRSESLELLEHFLQIRLSNFGTYQDALAENSYLVFHSKLSFAMNTKMLSPLEVIQATEAYWTQRQDAIHIAQVEGFIRQILGWREYMRGIYWAKMPEYADLNYFDHQEDLPDWFWTGETNMRCMQFAVGQSLDHAYAHHIQRLMVTGNFALLLGVHPDQVDEWYLGIYMDALEWVEITNTRGMSQFADGGIVGPILCK
ncbi:MAG: cryptochrome/photolyase family protein [Bacteroidota bacterium]